MSNGWIRINVVDIYDESYDLQEYNLGLVARQFYHMIELDYAMQI